MKVQRLSWDSDFFEYEIGKLEIPKNAVFNEEAFLKNVSTFDLVYVMTHDPVKNSKLKQVDRKVIFHQSLRKNIQKSIDSNIVFFDSMKHNYKELLDLGYESGLYSRFKTDVQFKQGEFKRLYKRWIDVSVSEKDVYEVIVYVKDNKILGFISYSINNKNRSSIGLVAVHSKARGKGIATKLLEVAIKNTTGRNMKYIEVATQLNNIPAHTLYKKCGFSQKSLTYIYHFWNI